MDRQKNKLEALAGITREGSLCGLGKTAPNPAISSLRYFRDEYEAHIKGLYPAKKYKPLIKYAINDNCNIPLPYEQALNREISYS